MKGCPVTLETQSGGRSYATSSTFVVQFCLFWLVCCSCCLRHVLPNQPHTPSRPVLLEGYQPTHTNSIIGYSHLHFFWKSCANHSNHSILPRSYMKPCHAQRLWAQGFPSTTWGPGGIAEKMADGWSQMAPTNSTGILEGDLKNGNGVKSYQLNPVNIFMHRVYQERYMHTECHNVYIYISYLYIV